MFNLFLYIVFNLFPGQNSPIRTFIPTLRIVYVLCSKTPGIRRRFPLVSPIYRLITENEVLRKKIHFPPASFFFFIQYIQYSRSTLIFSFLSDVTDETKKIMRSNISAPNSVPFQQLFCQYFNIFSSRLPVFIVFASNNTPCAI